MGGNERRRRRLLALLGAVVALVVLAVYCDLGPHHDFGVWEMPEGAGYGDALLWPCDTDDFVGFAARAFPDRATDRVLVSARDLAVTEVHDCQRLVLDGDLGPLTGLLVSRSRLESEAFTGGMVLAEVLAYDGDRGYPDLGIRPGWNCLWVRGDPVEDPRGTGWIASVRQPIETENCAQERFDQSPRDTLEVRRLRHGDDLYPSTGRWMWDPEAGRNFIGIRCGDGWCEIGPRGFRGTQEIAHPDSVPGWWDEQPLSYLVGEGGDLQLSGLLGRISPVPGARDLPPDAGGGCLGVEMARITITGDDPVALEQYLRKFGLEETGEGASGIVTFRTRRTCVGGVHLPVGPSRSEVRGERGRWAAVRVAPASHGVQGSVRWAWDENDEASWFPCRYGCCRTDGDLDPE